MHCDGVTDKNDDVEFCGSCDHVMVKRSTVGYGNNGIMAMKTFNDAAQTLSSKTRFHKSLIP